MEFVRYGENDELCEIKEQSKWFSKGVPELKWVQVGSGWPRIATVCYEELGLMPHLKVSRYQSVDYVGAMADKSLSNDLPGIQRLAQRQASLPPPAPPAPKPERVAPQGVLKGFNFDHRNGTGGTHELG